MHSATQFKARPQPTTHRPQAEDQVITASNGSRSVLPCSFVLQSSVVSCSPQARPIHAVYLTKFLLCSRWLGFSWVSPGGCESSPGAQPPASSNHSNPMWLPCYRESLASSRVPPLPHWFRTCTGKACVGPSWRAALHCYETSWMKGLLRTP